MMHNNNNNIHAITFNDPNVWAVSSGCKTINGIYSVRNFILRLPIG